MTASELARRGRGLNRWRSSEVARAVVVAATVVVTLIPLAWIVLTAFQPDAAVTAQPIQIWPRAWTMQNVIELFTTSGSLAFILHSLIATIGSTIAVIAIATPTAYALGRHRFTLNAGGILAIAILAARFIPGFMLIIPQFIMFRNLHLLDSVGGLILIYAVMNLPLAVWVILPTARQLPHEVVEAAALDGATTTRTFLEVALPLLRPAMATAATLSMVFAWNEFFVALVFTQTQAQTAPLLVSSFQGNSGIQWGGLAATSLVVAVPMVLLGIVAQKHLVRGITAGSTKG